MRWELWLGTVLGFVVLVSWFSLLSSVMFVDVFNEDGFQLRNLFGVRRFVRWNNVTPPAQRFGTFLPRLMIRREGARFFRLFTNYIVVLRARDEHFARIAQDRLRVVDVKQLSDITKR
jgi:hypothetical protein